MVNANIRWAPAAQNLIVQANPQTYIVFTFYGQGAYWYTNQYRVRIIATLKAQPSLKSLDDAVLEKLSQTLSNTPLNIRNRGYIPWYVSQYFKEERLENRLRLVERIIRKAGGELDVVPAEPAPRA